MGLKHRKSILIIELKLDFWWFCVCSCQCGEGGDEVRNGVPSIWYIDDRALSHDFVSSGPCSLPAR